MKNGTNKWHSGVGYRLAAVTILLALGVVLISLQLVSCEDGTVQNVVTDVQNGEVEWEGNGSDNNCPEGGALHWILTPGGNVTLISGTLHVEFADNTSGDFDGYFQGQGQGAMHFDSVGSAAVVSAIVTFTYTGDPGNQVLTISHSDCNTTTTESGETTTTEGETTTTVGTETTVTSLPTTTTVGSETTVTSLSTTTTVGTQTTVTSLPTTTTVVGNVTTTTSPSTTTTARSSTTTTLGSETTSTTVQSQTTVTAGRIDTGGGGTSGSGGMVWLVVGLLGSAMVALGWSSARSIQRAKP